MIEKLFKVKERNSSLLQEFRGGTVTFITIAYTIAVAPAILTESGGPCTVDDCTTYAGNPACMFIQPPDEGYTACLSATKASLISACTLICGVCSIMMGFLGNAPLGMVIGMGLAPYFTYNVVGFHGGGTVDYGTAVTSVLFTGVFFVILSVSGVRGYLIKSMPKSLLFSITAGIGLFLTHLGLQQADGLGIITGNSATLVTLGGCPAKDRASYYTIQDPSAVCVANPTNISAPIEPNLGPPSSNYICLAGVLRSPTLWLGVAGLLLISFCTLMDVKGATMIGVLFVTFISWIPGHGASYFGAESQVPGGEARWDFFKKVVTLPHFGNTWVAYKWDLGNANFWLSTFTMLYVGFFDTTGCLYAMGNFLDQYLPGFIDPKTKEFPRMNIAFTTDGVCGMLASLGGLSPICVSGESGAGIREGGRTGIAAIVVGLWFLVSMFFAPLFASIPPYATGPALIVVGALMMSTAAEIDWNNPMKSIPAFITMAMMPLTYSIAYGVIAGLLVYLALRIMRKLFNLFMAHVMRRPGKYGYKPKVVNMHGGDMGGGDDDDSDDESTDDAIGVAGMSYTGDFVSQAAIRRSLTKKAGQTLNDGHVEMVRGAPLADQAGDDDDLEKM